MNILFLSTWFPYPADNGSKIRVYHLLQALNRCHDVTLVSFAFGTAVINNPQQHLPFCKKVITVSLDPFATNNASQMQQYLSLTPTYTRPIPAMVACVQEVLNSEPFDLIIASTEQMAVYALQNASHLPIILEEHNSLTRLMADRVQNGIGLASKARSWMSWQKARRYEAQLFNQFDLVTMVSEQDRDVSLHQLPGYAGPVKVVPNGVADCDIPLKSTSPTINSLVYNGALTYAANYAAMQYFLAEIFPAILELVPDVSITITGSTQGVDLTGLKLSHQVHLSGYVEDIQQLVADAAVCVVPLLTGGGTRLKVLEAMSLGVPVVSTSKGVEGLGLQAGEHYLCGDAPQTFATQTIKLLTNPDLSQKLAKQAQKFVQERYQWSQIGEQFLALIDETVSSR